MDRPHIITGIDIFQADIALKEPFRISIMEITSARNVIIRLQTDSGVFGLGEAAPFWRICGETREIDLAAARDLALLLKGKDPLAIEDRIRDMEGYLTHNTTIVSAFEMALWDILGKAAGLPLYAILGGRRRELVTDLTIGLDTPDSMANKALEIRALGFNAIKVKLGTTLEQDVARIAAIRAAVGPEIPLRIDANQGWDPTTAIATLRALEPFGIQYCEQPVAHWNHAALKRARAATTIPIMADEAVFNEQDAFALCRDECCDYLNIKLSKSGGIRHALDICAVAQACGAGCMVGCMMESRLGLTATAHVAAARDVICFVDLDTAWMLAEDPVIGGITYDGERVTLPDTPGIGAEFRESFLERCAKVSM